MHPALTDAVTTSFVDAWAQGDANIDVELRSSWAEKDDNFKITDITLLKELLESQVATGNSTLPPSIAKKESALSVEAAQIQRGGCELALEKITYDVQLVANYNIKLTDRTAAQYHQLLGWRKERAAGGDKVAAAFIKERVIITVSGDIEEWFTHYAQIKATISKHVGMMCTMPPHWL